MVHLKDLITVLNRPIVFHLPSRAHLLKKGEHGAHMAYLGAVGVEAHGLYAHMAILLLGLLLVGLFVKED